jgi:AcrR family transcriptional regulator
MPPRRVHDEALRATLLSRAAERLSTQGPDALSLRSIARDVGTSTTAVYSLFGSKAALFEELYREAVARFAAELTTVEPTDDAAADLVRLGVAYRQYALTDPHLYEIMFNHTWSEPSSLAREAAETFQPLVDTVRRAQRSGQLKPAPAETIALACWATAHGLVTLELNRALPENLTAADHYTAILTATVNGWRA